MKKFFSLVASVMMLFAVGAGLTSCADDDEDDTTTIIDKSYTLSYGNVQYTFFTLNATATITVDVNCTTNGGVKVYLVDDTNLALLLADKTFTYQTALSSNVNVTGLKKSATLPSGKWNIAVANTNIASQTVSVKITAN